MQPCTLDRLNLCLPNSRVKVEMRRKNTNAGLWKEGLDLTFVTMLLGQGHDTDIKRSMQFTVCSNALAEVRASGSNQGRALGSFVSMEHAVEQDDKFELNIRAKPNLHLEWFSRHR